MSISITAGPPPGAFFGKPRKGAASVLRVAVYTFLTLSAMVATVRVLLYPPQALLSVPAKARPAERWVEIVKPYQLYNAPSLTFGAQPLVYTARRHTGGDGRIDSMVYGSKTPAEGAWLSLEMQRTGTTAAPAPLFADLARQAARSGISIGRAGLPALLSTRFGDVVVIGLQLDSDSRHSPCLGFRLINAQPAFAISGLACGTAARPVERETLACLIDRIDLVAAGDDHALSQYFARTELQRSRNCAASHDARAPSAPEWLAGRFTPNALKGSLAALAVN